MKKYIYEHPIVSCAVIGVILNSLINIVKESCEPVVEIFIIDSKGIKEDNTSHSKQEETKKEEI